jgi:hypothetical protein
VRRFKSDVLTNRVPPVKVVLVHILLGITVSADMRHASYCFLRVVLALPSPDSVHVCPFFLIGEHSVQCMPTAAKVLPIGLLRAPWWCHAYVCVCPLTLGPVHAYGG